MDAFMLVINDFVKHCFVKPLDHW